MNNFKNASEIKVIVHHKMKIIYSSTCSKRDFIFLLMIFFLAKYQKIHHKTIIKVVETIGVCERSSDD